MSQKWLDEETEDVQDEDEPYLSASRLKTYEKCPMQYYLSYVQDLPEEKVSKGYRELGTAVHLAIENVLEEEPIMQESTLSRKFKTEYGELTEDVMEKHVGDGIDCLNVAARFLDKVQPEIVGIEQEMDFRLKSLDKRFYGFADIVSENTIIDWKSGKMYDDGPKHMEQVKDNRYQAGVYMAGYKHLYGKPPDKVIYAYLKEGKARTLAADDETWDAMYQGAKNVVNGLENSEFPAKPGGKCFFCGQENFCDASPYSYQQFDYEELPL